MERVVEETRRTERKLRKLSKGVQGNIEVVGGEEEEKKEIRR